MNIITFAIAIIIPLIIIGIFKFANIVIDSLYYISKNENEYSDYFKKKEPIHNNNTTNPKQKIKPNGTASIGPK